MPRPHRRRPRPLIATAAAAALAAAGITFLPGDDASAATARQAERLDRGLVSVHTDAGNPATRTCRSARPPAAPPPTASPTPTRRTTRPVITTP